MCDSCHNIKHSFFVRKILFPISILFNIGLTIYLIISNTLNYDKYQKRESYVVYHVPNTTSNYYIIRENINGTINCSSNALFTFNVTTVYNNIISRTGENFLFITVYWLTTIVAVLISIFDIVLTIVDHYTQHDDIYESVEEETSRGTKTISSIGSQLLQKGSFLFPTYFIGIFDYTQLCLPHHTKESLFILHHTYIGIGITLGSTIYLILWTLACWDSRGTKTISSIGSQLLQKGSFLFPTYFIGIFDYTQLCLPHHTKESLFILHHTYIGIGITLGSTIYLILWTLACWDSRRHGYGKGILWIKCENRKAFFVIVILLCLTVIPLGVYGIFVWITSLMEFILTTKAVLISFNFILGIIHELIKNCKHH
ncbi:unnamed protein product [Adineta steineri]|uniref:Uncharacterized protein n=1 Tax=Adineta steineri TaxID=433720 RepID=A0A814MN84_9BILA|nr:unnamed protein product [Adineta steineri]